MILILSQGGTETAAQAISAAITQEYSLPVPPEVVGTAAIWSGAVEWDDLLLVVYNSAALPAAASDYIEAFRAAHKTGGGIVPVGVNPAFPIPPHPISGIKAAPYDGSPQAVAKIVQSAGVFLGLSLRPGSQKIFVSYRATDGKALAQSVYDRLKEAGFDAWLDEAEENLTAGSDVQDAIRKNLEEAALVLLIDTPDAPDSRWVRIEVDLANAQLIPVLPAVAGGERTSRFIQLQGLRRWALVKQSGLDNAPLSDPEWDGVRVEIHQLLLSTFRRRLRILSRARKAFEDQGYRWQAVDDRLRMYRSEKSINALQKVVALSHCLVQDVTFLPALRAWWDYLSQYQGLLTVNQRLCIYDREKLLSDEEIETIARSFPKEINAILVHYAQLDELVPRFQ